MYKDKIVYICDKRECKVCVNCGYTTNIEHARYFAKEGDTFYEQTRYEEKDDNTK